ncbi:MAG: 23S rRNA (uracil(1939)-C(5))-methyltransferase RlmD [Sulfurihydrogenibium sp.]
MSEIVKIEKIVYGGYGLAKKDKVYFVPYTLPDEEVEVEIIEEKKDYSVAKPLRILKPSNIRQEAPCKHFTICGGCDFQHIPYQEQINIKKEILKDQLLRIGKIDIPIEKVYPSNPFGYRNKAQFKFDGKRLGFYKPNSYDIVDVDYCYLLKEDLNQIINPLKKFLQKYALTPSQIVVFSNSKNEKLVKLEFSEESEILNVIPNLDIYKDEIDDKIKGVGFYSKGKRNLLLGEDIVFENVENYKFRVSMDSFFQVNIFQIPNLINAVVEEVKNQDYKKAVDFYCGVGTLTVPLAFYVKEALGIESNEEAVKDAKANVKHNNLKNLKFLKAKTDKGLKYAKDFRPDLIVLDPPRSGLNKKIIKEIASMPTVKKVIYVSCNPSTLARDLKDFKDLGFKINKVSMIDMFPQTHHIESISVLSKI